jgi:hypothetical protein
VTTMSDGKTVESIKSSRWFVRATTYHIRARWFVPFFSLFLFADEGIDQQVWCCVVLAPLTNLSIQSPQSQKDQSELVLGTGLAL